MASSASRTFALISSPTDMLIYSLILPKILLILNFDGVTTCSLPTGKYFLYIYICIYICNISQSSY